MTQPKSSEWPGPRKSFVRWLRNYLDARKIKRALGRPRPRRIHNYDRAPFDAPVLKQEDIDGY